MRRPRAAGWGIAVRVSITLRNMAYHFHSSQASTQLLQQQQRPNTPVESPNVAPDAASVHAANISALLSEQYKGYQQQLLWAQQQAAAAQAAHSPQQAYAQQSYPLGDSILQALSAEQVYHAFAQTYLSE